MQSKIMDVKSIAEERLERCARIIGETPYHAIPHLGIISVGSNIASTTYTRGIIRDMTTCGIPVHHINLPTNLLHNMYRDAVENLNNDKNIRGIIVQRPICDDTDDEQDWLNRIHPHKDIDCMGADMLGGIITGSCKFFPCTPTAVIQLLHYYEIPLSGARCLVIGRSKTVGCPLSIMLMKSDATVSVAHSYTTNLAELCQNSDIIISAAGHANLVTDDMLSHPTVLIDVGVNKGQNGICGDISVSLDNPNVKYISQVPKGVGLLTRVCLIENLIKTIDY